MSFAPTETFRKPADDSLARLRRLTSKWVTSQTGTLACTALCAKLIRSPFPWSTMETSFRRTIERIEIKPKEFTDGISHRGRKRSGSGRCDHERSRTYYASIDATKPECTGQLIPTSEAIPWITDQSSSRSGRDRSPSIGTAKIKNAMHD